MRGRTDRRRRLPATLAGALSLADRERPLRWAPCRHGCRLVATAHGLWEWPAGSPPVRHCWRTIEEVRCSPTALTVRPAPQSDPVCAHILEPANELVDLVRALDAGSRLVDLAFTLPSGSRLRVEARTCRFEGTLGWTSQLHAGPGADPAADAALARTLVTRARREYGTVGGGSQADGPIRAG